MDKSAAIKRLDAIEQEAKELRKIIEEPKSIIDAVQDYNDIMRMSGTVEVDDEVKVKGFDEEENEVLKFVIKKMRICKIYREGRIIKLGEERWYAWYDVSSGFVFCNTFYDDSTADTSSASRFALPNKEKLRDFVKKFKYIDEKIIDLK